MTELEFVTAVRRMILDAPVRIPLAEFIAAYDQHRSVQRMTPQFAALRASLGDEGQAVLMAIQLAKEHKFFLPLWTMLVERLAVSIGDDPDAEAIAQAVAEPVGTMQQVLHAQGFRRISSWPGLYKAAKVTGLVRVDVGGGPPASGTGFLVGQDLLLTAAHVVASLLDGDQARPGSAEKIEVRFHNRLESEGSWPITCSVDANWLVALSPPLGDPPNLGSTDAADAPRRLDFVLIRLSRKVGVEIGFLDVRNPPDADATTRLTVIGYPLGGTDCVSDDHLITELETAACRMRHGASTLEGMSGSPCMDSAGKVVALHEGAVTKPPPYNRAVHLKHIRATIAARLPDPLAADSGPISSLTDAEARRAWVTAGQNALVNEADRNEWLREVEPFDLRTAAGAAGDDVFHPVFGRVQFQDWIDVASQADARQRIAFVTGRELTGKSFSSFILAAKIRNSGQQIVVLKPEVIRGQPFANVLNGLLAQVAARSSVPTNGAVSLRPEAGANRRDLTPDALDELEKLVKTRPPGAQQLWLAIDFGADSNVTAETAPLWKEFLIQAAQRKWLRAVVIGLRETRQREFAVALPADVPFIETLSDLTLDQFRTCLAAIVRAVAPTTPTDSSQFDVSWDAISERLPRSALLIFAVQEALRLRKVLAEP